MEKYTLNFGKFRQYDKKFITEIDGGSVTSVAFSGETLYIATTENTFEYSEGNLKKLLFKAEKSTFVIFTMFFKSSEMICSLYKIPLMLPSALTINIMGIS